MGNLMRTPVLLLNASYEAIRIIAARRAMTLLCKGVATVEIPGNIEVYPGITLPSVVRLRHYRHIPIRLQIVSRKHIYLRDGHQCQYCGRVFRSDQLTLDHIFPRARGGKSTWDNLVAACPTCNREKDSRTPEEAGMHLIRRPLPVTVHTSRFLLRTMGSEVEGWKRFSTTTTKEIGDSQQLTKAGCSESGSPLYGLPGRFDSDTRPQQDVGSEAKWCGTCLWNTV